MMAYATVDDLKARYGTREMRDLLSGDECSDVEGDVTHRAVATLSDASAEIDGVLAAAYGLPLPAAAYPLLTAIACDLARQRLYDDAPTEAVSNKARRARALLASIAAGTMSLMGAAGNTVARRGTAPAVSGPEPVMTEDNMARILR